jgi:hypothetical protein
MSLHHRLRATAFLLAAPLMAAGCAAARAGGGEVAAAADAMCEGQAPAPAVTTARGRITPGEWVRGDLLRGDPAADPPALGEDVWVYVATYDGPATVRIDFPRADVWLTARILYGPRGFDQLGVAGESGGNDGTHRMTFRAQPGNCYAFHVSTIERDTVSRATAYTLRVDRGSPVQPIRVGRTVDGYLGGGDQSRVQAALATIYYFEDWVIEDAGGDSLRVRMETDPAGEGGTLAVGTARAEDGSFGEMHRTAGRSPEIVFYPEPGRRYVIRTEMTFREMERRYRLTVERVRP